ncbi:MAG: PfkB family carbohydrate kinase [Actinomycetota bacterium]|nr:PfkB family carbohydrate kinase [Actinomycetota bacterium]
MAVTPSGRLDVACVGDNCVDVWIDGAGELCDRELAGGNAFNVAVELARRGYNVGYFGAIGDDHHGELILEAAVAAGVDVSRMVRVPGPTGRTVVARDPSGERRFVSEDDGVASTYRLDDVSGEQVSRCRWAHFSRQPDLARWAPALRARGTRCSCDLGLDGGVDVLHELAPALDVVFLSSSASRGRSGEELLDDALRAGARLAVVTLGPEGSIAARSGQRWRADAEPVPEVIDTLGAGDAFIAAFIAATLEEREVGDALRAGAVAGARACARWGLASPLQTDEVPA